MALQISKRWQTVFFIFSGIAINYCVRVSLSIAAEQMKHDLSWTDIDKGYMLSSFFWGYTIGQLPSALLAAIVGCKTTFSGSILLSSGLSLLFPESCKISFELGLFIRALIGLSSSALFPSIYTFFAAWVPSKEKTLMLSTSYAGILMGEIIGFALSGILVTSKEQSIGNWAVGGWPSVFYFFGALGVLFVPICYRTVHSSPELHPYISSEEKDLIVSQRDLGRPSESHEIDVDTGDRLNESSPADSNSASTQEISSPLRSGIELLIISRGGAYTSVSSSDNADKSGEQIIQRTDDKIILNVRNDSRMHPQPASGQSLFSSAASMPWKGFFTHPVSLTLLLNTWVYGYINFLLMTEVPSFLSDQLGFSLSQSGFFSALPYVANFFSVIFFGALYNYFQVTWGWSNRRVRQNATQIAFFGTSVCMVACSYILTPAISVFFLVMALFCYGASASGVVCCYLEMAPRYSSIMNTVGNCVGAFAGMAGPLIVGYLTTSFEDSSTGWRLVFLLTLFQSCVALVLFHFFQSSEVVEILNRPS
jgi:MFS family permease